MNQRLHRLGSVYCAGVIRGLQRYQRYQEERAAASSPTRRALIENEFISELEGMKKNPVAYMEATLYSEETSDDESEQSNQRDSF